MAWSKNITEWHDNGTGYLSIPFTWLLPAAHARVRQRDAFVKRWVLGGPAVRLMPEYVAGWDVDTAAYFPGVLQRVNPDATRTTEGCPNRCPWCGVRKVFPEFRALENWPVLPIVCDDNLLAAEADHFSDVVCRLRSVPGCDFNQGLDASLLTSWHAQLLATLQKPIIRLALDYDSFRSAWADAIDRLLVAGLAKSRIRTYVLCGFDGRPEDDWDRCRFVESFGVKALPMWYHRLDCLRHNEVTEAQHNLGWNKRKQRELMCWYYQHRTLAVRG